MKKQLILLSGLLSAVLLSVNAQHIYAQDCSTTFIGCFNPPDYWKAWIGNGPNAQKGEAIILFIRVLFRLVLIGSGIFALWKFIQAGFTFMNASDDPQKVGAARSQIIMTLVGLIVIGGAFVLVAIIGIIFFGNPMIFIQPEITGAPSIPTLIPTPT